MLTNNKIYFFPRYSQLGASSRYRVYQYIEEFKERGFIINIHPFFDDGYFRRKSIPKVLLSYFRRFFILLSLKKNSVIFIEKEVFPYFVDLVFILKLKGIRYILDYDDAIFHNYDLSKNWFIRSMLSNKIPYLMNHAKLIITGSPYLTLYANKFNTNVQEIPTSISLRKYLDRTKETNSNKFIIGWIGSKTTSKHLMIVKDVLVKFCLDFDCELNLIGFDAERLSDFPKDFKVNFIEWQEETEIEEISKFSVGLMPLVDEPFENGKCGFKLIQYMACGVPTISTPVIANVKINRDNNNLFASTESEWYECLLNVYTNFEGFNSVGTRNVQIVKEFYDKEVNFEIYNNLFKNIFCEK